MLYRHEAVHLCAVVGIPDERWGDVGVAYVVLKPGAKITEPELISFLQEHLARFKVPKSVIFKDQLPMSSMGKILKRELREELTHL